MEKLNWILNKLDDIDTYENDIDVHSGSVHWRLSKLIKSCIALIKKEDMVFFIGHDRLSGFEDIISLKLSSSKWS